MGTITETVLPVKIDPVCGEEARRANCKASWCYTSMWTHCPATKYQSVEGSGAWPDDQAVEAVRQWKFRPGTVNGKPSVTSAVIDVTFRLL